MRDPWRVALIDSGLDTTSTWSPVSACRFLDAGTHVSTAPVIPDSMGHGTRMAHVLRSRSDSLELMIGQVFDDSGRTTPATVAAAIRWAIAGEATLIHLSLGLREDRSVLADAIEAAVAADCIVVASTPARGDQTYPAKYPGVIRATGDIRCAANEISALDNAQADYGACPWHESQAGPRGASVGAASLTGFVVTHLPVGLPLEQVRARLTAMARYRGAEKKSTMST